MTARRPLRGLRRRLMAHLDSRQVSRVVYGAIIGLAVIISLERHPPSTAGVIASLVATAVAVALAELFSEVVGAETRKRRRVRSAELHPLYADAAAVTFGITFPSVFFVLAAAGLMKEATAFTVAKWSGIGLTAFYGFCASRLAGRSLTGSALYGLCIGAIAGLLIGLKALVH